jgi:hypothetical protein
MGRNGSVLFFEFPEVAVGISAVESGASGGAIEDVATGEVDVGVDGLDVVLSVCSLGGGDCAKIPDSMAPAISCIRK